MSACLYPFDQSVPVIAVDWCFPRQYMSVTMTMSASSKHVQNSSNKSRRRVNRCGCTTAITLFDALVCAAASTAEISRMVAIVVDNCDIVDYTGSVKTPFYPAKFAQGMAYHICIDAHFMRNGYRC